MIKLTKLKVIKALEKEIGIELSEFPVDAEEMPPRGFAIDKAGIVTKLLLFDCNLSDISILSSLPHLSTLILMKNQLSDISVLSGLRQLTTLDLGNNQIKKLPSSILELDMDIDVEAYYELRNKIYLGGNPLESPPPEIIEKGRRAIWAYFKSLETGERLPLNEAKVLLVGDGGAGKTSLVKRMQGKTFDQNEPQTHGIKIDHWPVKCGTEDVTTRIWDFGGQEIMHATHQFFLSKRSLYILVLDGRKDEKTEYWLKHIQSFGGDSPVLVALNKMDENPGFEVNRKYLKEKYPNIIDFYRVSCATGGGIEDFSHALAQALDKVEIISTTWPDSWFQVKTRLEKMDTPFISYDQYRQLCEEENVAFQEGMKTLVEFLHDLGVVVHFEEIQLRDLHVLEPKWVTEAVYKIVNSTQLAEEKGILKLAQLDEILKQGKKGGYYYPKNTYPYIIQLMKKFELCYEIDMETILAPDLLDVEEPDFEFDDSDCLSFIFQYEFLPPSVMPRFIVRMHNDIQEYCRWRTGMLLQSKSFQAQALVKAHREEKRIAISVNGEQKRDYFSVLRHTLQDIHDSFEKLKTEGLVPLPDEPDVTVLLDELIGHELDGKPEMYVGRLGKSYDVKELLYEIVNSKEIQEHLERLVAQRDKGTDIYNLNINVLSAHLEQKTDVSVKVDIDIKVDLPAFKGQFYDLKEELEAAGVDGDMAKELTAIGDHLDELDLETGKKELNKPFNKVRGFLKKLADDNSGFNKVLRGTKRGVELAQKAAETYNKFAQWLALPQVPEVLLGKKE
jgi:small GTP-binding protein